MKRFFLSVLTISLLLVILCFSASAESGPIGATAPEDGALYNKIIYWQDYVLSSVQSGDKWDTQIGLPKASVWEITDGGGADTPRWYTSNNYSGVFYPDDRFLGLIWQNAFYVSLEDINWNDPVTIRAVLKTNRPMETVKFSIHYYDSYLNFLAMQEHTVSTLQGETEWVETLNINFEEQYYSLGAKYVKFELETYWTDGDYAHDLTVSFDWKLFLPYQFDPTRFAVDGLDAWMNGYFKPYEPNIDGEKDIWEYFFNNQVGLTGLYEHIKLRFSKYLQGFRFWSYMMEFFISVPWINDIFTTAFVFGCIAFLLDIAVDIGKASGKASRRKSTDKSSKKSKERNNN